jgi:nicotinamidase-related amidase
MAASSVLRPETAVLVVIDIQERLAAAMAHRDRVIAATSLLVRTSAIVGMPVVVTRQYPKGLGDHACEIDAVLSEARQAHDAVVQVDKVTFDCFAEPDFVTAVEAVGRRQLLIAGMETHICVCQTALAALRSGYDVHVAADACCSRADSNHAYALARLATAHAVVTTSESAAYELVGEAGTPEFKRLLAAVKGERPAG